MATIESKKIIDDIIASNGYYEGDPRVHMIVAYVSAWGKQVYGITWENERPDRRQRYLVESEFVQSPIILWRASDHRETNINDKSQEH